MIGSVFETVISTQTGGLNGRNLAFAGFRVVPANDESSPGLRLIRTEEKDG